MILKTKFFELLAASIAIVILAGCGGGDEGFPPYDNTEEVEQYYKDRPEFFITATPGDIPADLIWEDGSELPEIGSPKAIKGGTRYSAIQSFPKTLRLVGNDSNNSFRPMILDDTRMRWARRHPNDTTIGETGFKYFPGMADRWALDKENKTVYIHINPKARFSDGEPITTEDVFFMYYFYQSPHIQQPWYNNWFEPGENYDSITKFDDHTFAVELAQGRPDMKFLALDWNPIPRNFFREFGKDYMDRYQWKFVPTSGAYEVLPENLDKNRSISLTKVKDWWAKDLPNWRYRYNYDKIRFSVIRDTSKRFEMFKKGELDSAAMNLAEYWYDKLPNDASEVENGYVTKSTFYNDIPRPTYGLWINSATPLLDNRDIREGINYATNWQIVCEKYFRGDAIRMNTTADGYGEFSRKDLKSRPYNIEKALEAFARAGFTERDSDGILINDKGQKLSFSLSSGYESLADILTILQEEARNAGLQFRVEILDGSTGWKKVQEKQHEIHFSAFGVAPEMYPRYWETYHSVNAYDQAFLEDGSVNPDRKPKTQTNNLMLIAIPKLDKLIEQYDSSEDAKEMQKIAYEMEQILYDDATFIPGFILPFYRTASWSWVHSPDDYNVKLSTTFGEYFLHWMDVEEKETIMSARKKGEAYSEPVIEAFDQYKMIHE